MLRPGVGPRTSFLRYRLVASAFGLGLLLLGAVPWLILIGTAQEGAASALWGLLLVVWGFFFLPVLWLGAQVLRLAWRPLQVFSWKDMMRGRSGAGGPRGPAHGTQARGNASSPAGPGRREVIDAEVVADDERGGQQGSDPDQARVR